MSFSSNQEAFEVLQKFECQDATFRPDANPIVIEKGLGSKVWDLDGNAYTDLCAGFGSLSLGHNPEGLNVVIQKTLSSGLTQGIGDVFATKSKIELFETLHNTLPKYLNKSCLAVTGGQAVEYAIKTAFLAKNRHHLAVVQDGYHGLDIGVLSTTSNPFFRKGFEPWLHESKVHVVEYSLEEEVFCASVEKTLSASSDIAALLMEPIQGRAGTREFSISCLKKISEICHKHDVLLIFDEILVGLGRTGRMSFSEEIDVDITCLGKALGAGMPISVCVGKSEVMDAWDICKGEARHTGTFFGHPLSCAVAKKSLELLGSMGILQEVTRKGAMIESRILESLSGHPLFIEIRGQGLMQVIQLAKPGLGAEVMNLALKEGVLLIPSAKDGSCVSITPALNIEDDLLMESIDKIIEIIMKLN